MIKVKVKPFFQIKDIIGREEVDLETEEGGTIVDLLLKLEKTYGDGLKLIDRDTGSICSFYRVLLNGRDYRCLESRQNSKVEEGQVVSIFPPIAGG